MRILFATDGSPGAEAASKFLQALPLSIGDRVSVLTVAPHRLAGPSGGEGANPAYDGEDNLGAAASIAERARATLSRGGVQACVLIREGPVATAIERASIERAEELIVIGSRGLGAISGILLGSTGRALARHGPTSLLVVRDRSDRPKRVLAAVDTSPESGAAIDLLARLPLPADIEITLLHVLAEREEADAEQADAALARASKTLHGRYVARTVVERGDPAERIALRAIAGGADLVVLGSRGQHEPHGLLRTSIADDVLLRAHCAVLVAKPPLAPWAVHADARPSAVLTLA